jgi:hypothetical protein
VADGGYGFKCPQAYPEWSLVETTEARNEKTVEHINVITSNPWVSEDGFYLEFVAPISVFDSEDTESTGG